MPLLPLRLGELCEKLPILADDAALAGADEIDQYLDLGMVGVFAGEFIHGLRGVERFVVKDFIGRTQGLDVLVGEALALEPDRIHATHFGRISVRDEERRGVLHDLGATADDGVGADPAELVNSGESADDGVIADFHMTRERGVVGKNRVTADDAIMRHVRVGEKQIVRADARPRIGSGAAVHRGEFAKDVVVADLDIGRLALVFQVLRFFAD